MCFRSTKWIRACFSNHRCFRQGACDVLSSKTFRRESMPPRLVVYLLKITLNVFADWILFKPSFYKIYISAFVQDSMGIELYSCRKINRSAQNIYQCPLLSTNIAGSLLQNVYLFNRPSDKSPRRHFLAQQPTTTSESADLCTWVPASIVCRSLLISDRVW